jgi:membrane protease subunit (stomatin/prohibitin family)
MGLIKNALNAVGNAAKEVGTGAGGALLGGFSGVLNQSMYQEYYTSGTMAGDVIMKRAEQVKSNGSVNNKSDANIISNGSMIDVQPSQCMIIVENGKIVEACMEPGRFVYNTDLAPSFFAGNGKFGEKIVSAAKEMWEQAKVGGQRHNTQRIYFINMGILEKSILWGVGRVQFRHTQRFVTNAAPYVIGVRLKGNGTARVQMMRPLDFYTLYGAQHAGGDNNAVIRISDLEKHFFEASKSHLMTAISGAITALGTKQELTYEEINSPENMTAIAESVNKAMAGTDLCKIGFDFSQFAANDGGFTVTDEDYKKIQDAQQKAYDVGNINLMNYNVQMGQVEAMKEFGKNSNVQDMGGGGMMMMGGMMGCSMGNIQAQPLQQFPQQPQPQMAAVAVPSAPAADGWTCSCGAVATGKFCNNCGAKKPEPKPVDGWTCACGAVATGKFCPECGAKKPEPVVADGWTCACGHVNKGKFCQECGSKKPADAPLYRCDKCGWEPADPKNPPRFCPECGDRFDDSDIK